MLPMAGTIGKEIFCTHSGIGSTIGKVEEINALQRPFELVAEVTTPEQQMAVDLLWSDPDDSISGVKAHASRDPKSTRNIVKFGPDRVAQFLSLNGFSKMIRSHETAVGGFGQAAGGDVITLTSCSNYCGMQGNLGALCSVNKALKLKCKALQAAQTPVSTWEEQKRPVTPPRFAAMTFKK